MNYTHVGHAALHWSRSRSSHAAPRLNSDHALNRVRPYVYHSLCGRTVHADPDDGDYGEYAGAEVRKGQDGVTCLKCQRASAPPCPTREEEGGTR